MERDPMTGIYREQCVELESKVHELEARLPRLTAENLMLKALTAADMLGEDRLKATRSVDRKWLLRQMCSLELNMDHNSPDALLLEAIEVDGDEVPGDVTVYPPNIVTGRDLGKGM